MITQSSKLVIYVLAILLLEAFALHESKGQQILYGTVRQEIGNLGLQSIGQLDTTSQLELAIGLPLRNQAELRSMIQEIYNPTSPQYRHFLSVQQFTAEFGPLAQDCDAVIAFAEANGLSLIQAFPNNMLLSFRGRVADIERAFNTRLLLFRHPTESRTFYSPDRDPTIGMSVPILQISGLDNYASLHCGSETSHKSIRQVSSGGTGSGPNGSYIGYDFRKAYAQNVTLDGTGQQLGLLEFGSYDNSDIVHYEQKAGLPAVTLSNEVVIGNPGKGLWDEEVCGDIEMAISMAPGISKIIVYEAEHGNPETPPSYQTRFEDILNMMASDNLAKELSSSFFIANTPSDANADQAFIEMAVQGQSFFECSADVDAYNYLQNGQLVTAIHNFPCGDPYISVVGGTALTTTGQPNQNWSSETVWNADSVNGSGSSGGYTSAYAIPIWQQGINMSNNLGSGAYRNVPDVAMIATNIYLYYDGIDDSAASGTSFATPLWAGFVALINESLGASGGGYAGFINPTIYRIASGAHYSSDFHDVAAGNNVWSLSQNRFPACQGYDLCTGFGSPIGQGLISDFAPSLSVIYGSTLTVPSGQTLNIAPGMTVTFTNGASLIVNGSLNAVGNASQPITL